MGVYLFVSGLAGLMLALGVCAVGLATIGNDHAQAILPAVVFGVAAVSIGLASAGIILQIIHLQ